MLDRPWILITALTFVVIGIVVEVMTGRGGDAMTALGLAVLFAILLLFLSPKPKKPQETDVTGPASPLSQTLLDHPDFSHWINQEVEPVLGSTDNIVTIANDAAIALLGHHIIGADVRTAIRHPASTNLLSQDPDLRTGQMVNLVDFPRTGQRWTMRIAELSRSQYIIYLSDRSEMDAVERMRSDFVANASHELRTPLSAIIGYVEPLQEMTEGEADPQTRARFLEIIAREAHRMQRLVDDLLSVSRIETDRYRRPTTAADLSAIVRQTVVQLRDSHRKRAEDINLIIEDGPNQVLGDPAQLAQLARNIITNAMKYGHANTPVTVRLIPGAGRVELKVSDVGDGIEADQIPRLTERFYRVDAARSRSVGGTGLGLAIVKHISERHQGRLDIHSEIGRGTCVSVSFPLLAGGEATPATR